MSEPARKSRNFHAANEQRVMGAAARDAEIARDALTSGAEMNVHEWRIVQARADHPGESWQQIATRLGISKNAAACAFRRFRRRVAS